MSLRMVCLVAMLLGSGTLPAADEIFEAKLIDISKKGNQVVDHLDFLCNRIGPRLTASDADIHACNWAKEKFEEWGLQNVVMEEAGEFAVGFNRGPWSGRMISPEPMALEFGTAAWSAGTRGAQQGVARMAPAELGEDADLEAYRDSWVFLQRAAGRRGGEARRKQREVMDALTEVGVLGFVFPTRDKYIRTSGNARIKWENLPTVPRINLLKDHWDAIAKHLEENKEVVLEFDIRNYFKKGPVKYYNVIGEIKGVEKPDEFVVIGGHIDSWDGATGTTDNGMGTAVAMEAARLLAEAGARPRRTIKFMLWSGEEQGLLGSRAWVEKNEDILDKCSGCFVYDGGPNVIAGIDSSEAMYEALEEVFTPVMKLEYPFEIKKQAGLPMGLGSDHLSFLQKGVPGFFWTQKGKADWRHGIHTQYDTFDLCVPEYLEHSALVVALTAVGVADLDELLSRENMRARRGGGNMANRPPQGRRMGVYLDEREIIDVIPNSVAQKAGLKAGDVFVEVDGKGVSDRQALVSAIQAGDPKKKVVIKRGSQRLEIMLEWTDEKKKKAEIY